MAHNAEVNGFHRGAPPVRSFGSSEINSSKRAWISLRILRTTGGRTSECHFGFHLIESQLHHPTRISAISICPDLFRSRRIFRGPSEPTGSSMRIASACGEWSSYEERLTVGNGLAMRNVWLWGTSDCEERLPLKIPYPWESFAYENRLCESPACKPYSVRISCPWESSGYVDCPPHKNRLPVRIFRIKIAFSWPTKFTVRTASR